MIEKTVRTEILRVKQGQGGREGSSRHRNQLFGSVRTKWYPQISKWANEAEGWQRSSHCLNSESVMRIVRSRRPGSIETERQGVSFEIIKSLWKRFIKTWKTMRKTARDGRW